MFDSSPTLLKLIDRATTPDATGRKFTLGTLAERAGYDASLLSRIRGGARPPTDLGRLYLLLDDVAQTPAERVAVLDELAAWDRLAPAVRALLIGARSNEAMRAEITDWMRGLYGARTYSAIEINEGLTAASLAWAMTGELSL